jgi:urea carboxylase-associated protein 1
MDTPAVSGTIVEDTVVPAKAPWSRIIKKGEMLRLVDLHGRQAIDFLCYSADDPEDRYNAADTMKLNGSIFLGKGTVIYTDREHALFTIVEDTCGFHDTIGGCCSAEINTLRYGVPWQPNCRDNFLSELGRHGLGKKDVVTNINFFMYVPVGKNGEMGMGPSISKPGDYVDLRAETDVLAVLSNCPQVNNPVNDFNPTPIRVIVWQPA